MEKQKITNELYLPVCPSLGNLLPPLRLSGVNYCDLNQAVERFFDELILYEPFLGWDKQTIYFFLGKQTSTHVLTVQLRQYSSVGLVIDNVDKAETLLLMQGASTVLDCLNLTKPTVSNVIATFDRAWEMKFEHEFEVI